MALHTRVERDKQRPKHMNTCARDSGAPDPMATAKVEATATAMVADDGGSNVGGGEGEGDDRGKEDEGTHDGGKHQRGHALPQDVG